jgi:peroxiredoxin
MTNALACAALLVCAATTSCSSADGVQAPGATPDKPAAQASAPDFSLKSTDGRTVHLSDYLGKSVVLIDFWSTTCDPCMAEMPYLVDLYKAKKGKGFVVLAISLDGPESLADVNRVVHDKEMIFPVLLDQETTVVARYNPKREMPFAVLIDKSGAIVEKKAGYTPGDEKGLAAAVEKMVP